MKFKDVFNVMVFDQVFDLKEMAHWDDAEKDEMNLLVPISQKNTLSKLDYDEYENWTIIALGTYILGENKPIISMLIKKMEEN